MKKALLIVSVAAAVLSVVAALAMVFLYVDDAFDLIRKAKSLFSLKSIFTKNALKE